MKRDRLAYKDVEDLERPDVPHVFERKVQDLNRDEPWARGVKSVPERLTFNRVRVVRGRAGLGVLNAGHDLDRCREHGRADPERIGDHGAGLDGAGDV